MPLYELINRSDPYTFEAPNIEVAGVAVGLLSTGFGAKDLTQGSDESSPILFGWDEWLKDHSIDKAWFASHREELADALESFLIGDQAARADAEDVLRLLPEGEREAWRSRRQDRRRSSMNDIGGAAYRMAKRLRNQKEPDVSGGAGPGRD